MAERVLAQRPPPQFSEHLVPSQPQGETLQSMGQPKVLQVVVETRVGQPRPPKAAAVRTERVLVLVPVPQDLVQEPYLVQAETLQSTGQAWRLQVRSCSEGHSSPPWAAAVFTTKVRDWTPVPQDLEQAVQAFQVSTQSMGQGWVLQSRRDQGVGQARPPWAARLTTERVLDWTPPPHFSVQVFQADHMETLQSMGHAKVLQVVVALRVAQRTPP